MNPKQTVLATCKRKSLPSKFVIASLVIAVILIYVWFAIPRSSNEWEAPTNYYDLLATGFRNASLHLSLDPDPQLLALPNPYDPLARAGLETKWDLSLYQGKYYLYWGPVPALILSGIYSFFHGTINDLTLALVFISGLLIVQVLLIFILWNRYFYNLPRLLLYLTIPLIGLTGPLILLRHNYESAKVYEAAISGGQFFFMSGMLAALTAMAHSPISIRKLLAAVTLWALAIGTRQTLAMPVGFMAVLLAFWFFRTNDWSLKKTVQVMPLALPLIFCFVCIAWYNQARFGSFTETGFYYALAGINVQERYHELFSPAYIVLNLYNYLFNAIVFTNEFPFVIIPLGTESFSSLSMPDVYAAEPITGLLYTFPFVIFAGLPLLASSSRREFLSTLDTSKRNDWNLTVLSLSGSFLIAFGLLMLFFWSSMRYAEDFMPSLIILSIIGFWQGCQSLSSKPSSRKLYMIFGVFLASSSILLNILLAISTNHELVKLITHFFSFQ